MNGGGGGLSVLTWNNKRLAKRMWELLVMQSCFHHVLRLIVMNKAHNFFRRLMLLMALQLAGVLAFVHVVGSAKMVILYLRVNWVIRFCHRRKSGHPKSESQTEEKFELDIMAPPPLQRTFPEMVIVTSSFWIKNKDLPRSLKDMQQFIDIKVQLT
ncbi:hypothetical protein Tco_0179781 [Tanacetum coccineum]